MATANVWRKFQELTKGQPILTGQVVSHNGDGTSTLTMTGGGTLRALGETVPVGNYAFVQGMEIIGEAPALAPFNLEVS